MGWLTVALLVGFCIPLMEHKQRDFQNDEEASAILQDLASYACFGEPETPFYTDGCSASPDGEWVHCCIIHDIRYWCGGTYEERVRADEELSECVAEFGYGEVHGDLTETGVRIGGSPYFPFRWRWGYGYSFPKGYTDTQQNLWRE